MDPPASAHELHCCAGIMDKISIWFVYYLIPTFLFLFFIPSFPYSALSEQETRRRTPCDTCCRRVLGSGSEESISARP